MAKVLSIDPGKSKCGLVLAQINEKKVYEATVLNSEFLEDYIKNLNNIEDISKIVIPSNKDVSNILLWRTSDMAKIENFASSGGSWILIIKSATNVLRGDNYVFVSPDLLENKYIVRKGDIIKSYTLEKSDLNLKSIDLQIKSLLRETRDEIKSKGSQVSEIKTNGTFIKKIRDFLQENQNIKFKLEVVSLRDSKTVEPIIVEINILKIAS